ncbi:MAG TPA: FtsX-like permease family protein [Vicinamibacterales bacterium]|nr:FtsX-like permease family protein [Vicinamibacterales bacterium]
MKFLPLVWKNIWRRKFRTTFTLLSIFIAFVLFGILMTIRYSFSFGVEIAGADRLVLIHKISLIMPLPVSYQARLQQVPGVQLASHQTWFGGIYQDPSNFFANIAVVPEPFLKIYPEFVLPPDQLKGWLDDRQGAIIGRDLATRFGWKIGDRIPLTAPIWLPKGGGTTWEFNIRGIYDGGDMVDKTQMFFRYDYLDENRIQGEGQVGWYVVKISDPSKAVELAHSFDEMFANSSAETKTTTEKGFVEGFAKQIGDIGSIMIAISSTVLFMFGLVAASTMAQSVRERTSELAVLKTLGFSDTSILGLVLTESLFIAFTGGLLGLGLAWLFVQGGDPTRGMLPIFVLPARDVAIGVGLMAVMGLVAGVMPAIAAMRLKITDALRRA